MADKSGTKVRCNEGCGCPVPCTGGSACRCASRETTLSGEDPNMQHMRCSCGDHCGCNPCTCEKIPVSGVGRDFCKCSDCCACATCTA